MEAILICEKMKWTYQEYENQPEWLINGIIISNNEKNKERRKKK